MLYKYKKYLSEQREYKINGSIPSDEAGLFNGLKNAFTKNEWDRRPNPDIPAGIYRTRTTSGHFPFNSSRSGTFVNYSKKDAYTRGGIVGGLVIGGIALNAYDIYTSKKRWRQNGCSGETPEYRPHCERYLKKLKNKSRN